MVTPESGATGGHTSAGYVATGISFDQPARVNSARVWAAGLVAAVVASVGAWLLGELTVGAFQPRLESVRDAISGRMLLQPTTGSTNAADFKNAVLDHAVVGCVTGLVLGLAGGLAGRALRKGVVAGVGAQAVGALVGAATAWGLFPFLYRSLVPDVHDLLTPILIHGGIYAAVGAVAGGAFALGAGYPRLMFHAAADACVAGFLASAIYHLAGIMLFPAGGSTEPVAGSRIVRLLAVSVLSIFVAVAAARATVVGARKSRASLAG